MPGVTRFRLVRFLTFWLPLTQRNACSLLTRAQGGIILTWCVISFRFGPFLQLQGPTTVAAKFWQRAKALVEDKEKEDIRVVVLATYMVLDHPYILGTTYSFESFVGKTPVAVPNSSQFTEADYRLSSEEFDELCTRWKLAYPKRPLTKSTNPATHPTIVH